jgi:hypothetical protein
MGDEVECWSADGIVQICEFVIKVPGYGPQPYRRLPSRPSRRCFEIEHQRPYKQAAR